MSRRDPWEPRVSVVIVNFQGLPLLKPCLESVFRQPYRNIEVILVDNGSTDGSVEWVTAHYQRVVLIYNRENAGFARANNQGTAAATGDVIVLLNNDTVVSDGWIPGLLNMLEQPGVMVVTSKVVTEGVPDRFYEMNGTINYLGYNIMRHFRDLSQVFFAGGASLAFRKIDIGVPFLPEYFLYHEDVFLSWRVRLAGYDVRMAQDSVVHHVGSASTGRQSSSFVTFYQERNRLLNALLLYDTLTLAKITPLIVLDFAAKCAASLLLSRKSFTGILRAYLWPIVHVRWLCSQRKALQGSRKVSDSEILSLMSSKLIDGDSSAARVINRVAACYARATGLSSHG